MALVVTFRPPVTDGLTPITPGCAGNDNPRRERKRGEKENLLPAL